jgi:hypothetical protein
MKRLLAIAATAAVTNSCAPPAQAQAGSMCQPATHSIARTKRRWVTDIVTGADSVNSRLRASYNLLATPVAEVTIVTDELICSKAAAAMATWLNRPQHPVWVIRAGPQRYVVYDGYELQPDGFTPTAVLDQNFGFLKGLVGGG